MAEQGRVRVWASKMWMVMRDHGDCASPNLVEWCCPKHRASESASTAIMVPVAKDCLSGWARLGGSWLSQTRIGARGDRGIKWRPLDGCLEAWHLVPRLGKAA